MAKALPGSTAVGAVPGGLALSQRTLITIGIVIAFGLLYCINLGRVPIPDELHHVLAAQGLLQTGEPRIADGHYWRAFLHTWMVAQSFKIFGEGLAAARVPTVIEMALLVGLVFFWVDREFGRLHAFVAALLFGTSPFAVELAQFSRFYALQMLSFFIASICLYEGLIRSVRFNAALIWALTGVAFLGLSLYLQPTTVMGIAGICAWLLVAVFVPWLRQLTRHDRRLVLIVTSIAAVVLIAVAWLFAGAAIADQFERFRYAPVFNRARSNEFWYYHQWLLIYYPTIWPLTGVLAIVAFVRRPQTVLFLGLIFAVSLTLNSLAAQKGLRYLAYAFPFIFILWAIGIIELARAAAGLARRYRQRLHRTLGWLIPRPGIAARAVGIGSIVFLALANPAWVKTATWLSSITIRPDTPPPHWEVARPRLAPLIEEVDVVVTLEELATLYYLGDYDIRISSSKLREIPKEERREFGRDHRTGRPIISSEASLRQVLNCFPSGIVVGPDFKWSRSHVIHPQMADLIYEKTTEVPLPRKSRVRAFMWNNETQTGGNCAIVDELADITGK